MGKSPADGQGEALGARGCGALSGSDRASGRARARALAGENARGSDRAGLYVSMCVLRRVAGRRGATRAQQRGMHAVCGGCGILELNEGVTAEYAKGKLTTDGTDGGPDESANYANG